ncbi:hypothetical protein PRIPAC_97952 [Pristionchus pacificus]|uniref:Uncharacterized protein n=1 Tax=Pristionchus pacificus TaxID=54126 RepID=A0A2A6BCK4_PRIPA|nr:hypothetical protein PRIPAC_97952 [Pristionchus pacificus]|eukprot:PDM63619.1 hypothetical protein PRIPAC_49592 [Pristionchus pacificus]
MEEEKKRYRTVIGRLLGLTHHRTRNRNYDRYSSPFSILALTTGGRFSPPALFHPQFGESSSVSLGNRTSIAHLDHQKEDPGRILIGSSDQRSRKAHSRRLLREFTLNHASQDFGGWMIYFVAQDLSTNRDRQSTTKS